MSFVSTPTNEYVLQQWKLCIAISGTHWRSGLRLPLVAQQKNLESIKTEGWGGGSVGRVLSQPEEPWFDSQHCIIQAWVMGSVQGCPGLQDTVLKLKTKP